MSPSRDPRRVEIPCPARVVVLVSGSGTLLQALIDADLPAEIVAVGSDRPGVEGLARAERAGIPTFVTGVVDHPDRAAWDTALGRAVAAYTPGLVVSAGFMKILGPGFLAGIGCPVLNTHPALLPSFPGVRGVADALAYGVKVTGATVHLVDGGVDTGPVLAQAAVPVEPGDTVERLHERIKIEERRLLVSTVAALARHGATVTGREVTIRVSELASEPSTQRLRTRGRLRPSRSTQRPGLPTERSEGER